MREVLPLVEQYELGGRRLNLLAQGRVVNLAAGEGHPAAVMDMSFANLALAVEHLVRCTATSWSTACWTCPRRSTRRSPGSSWSRWACEIDELTPDQREYLSSWGATP